MYLGGEDSFSSISALDARFRTIPTVLFFAMEDQEIGSAARHMELPHIGIFCVRQGAPLSRHPLRFARAQAEPLRSKPREHIGQIMRVVIGDEDLRGDKTDHIQNRASGVV